MVRTTALESGCAWLKLHYSATDKILEIETLTADFEFVHQDIKPWSHSPDMISAFAPLSPESKEVISQRPSRFAMNLTQEEMASFHGCRLPCIYIASYKETTDKDSFFYYTPPDTCSIWIWCLVIKVEQGVATRIGVVMIPEKDWDLANPKGRSWTIS
jgi:hypothetical protein